MKDTTQIEKELIRNLLVLAGLKISVYIFIAWLGRVARRAAEK